MKYVLIKGTEYFSRMERNPRNDLMEIITTGDVHEAKKYNLKNAIEMSGWIEDTTGEEWGIKEYDPLSGHKGYA